MRLKSKKEIILEDAKLMTDTERMRLYFCRKTLCMFMVLTIEI